MSAKQEGNGYQLIVFVVTRSWMEPATYWSQGSWFSCMSQHLFPLIWSASTKWAGVTQRCEMRSRWATHSTVRGSEKEDRWSVSIPPVRRLTHLLRNQWKALENLSCLRKRKQKAHGLYFNAKRLAASSALSFLCSAFMYVGISGFRTCWLMMGVFKEGEDGEHDYWFDCSSSFQTADS